MIWCASLGVWRDHQPIQPGVLRPFQPRLGLGGALYVGCTMRPPEKSAEDSARVVFMVVAGFLSVVAIGSVLELIWAVRHG